MKKVLKDHIPWLYTQLAKVKQFFYGVSIQKKNPYSDDFKAYEVNVLYPPIAARKKILHLIANFWTGGSARLVVDIVEHLGHIYEQEVLTLDVPKVPAYTGFPLTVIRDFENPATIAEAVNRFNPDIIHVHYLGHTMDEWGIKDWKWYDNAFRALEAYNRPVIENINIPTAPYINSKVTHYIYVSNYVKKIFGRAGDRNEVIYPGTDFTRFTRDNLQEVPDNCIGMVYRLERDKINEDSIKVFIEIVQRRIQTSVLIVGGGTLLEYYRKVVDDAGLGKNFHFTGYVSYDNLPRFFKKLSIFIAPVHNESFGQVSPMAMNMGIPVAGYNVGALPEIIADQSLLAPPGDYKKLATIVTELLDVRERRLRIGAANQKRAGETFSVESMIRSYRDIYASLAP